ncbi:hypothetical protein [Staphylococcus equorum]|uniref:hypothetical protein n=1 Tax=Staphylococcus equorum TaxID=246432 RepID=UPI000853C384|nr:hypothetical protein [Staphylococcus equorum]OEK55979.1 hypothetical protein ASS97_08390 [Staphylococcus equorum]OEK64167.1 hypothetical protein ASS98_05235 [Staphylococcus equorum]
MKLIKNFSVSLGQLFRRHIIENFNRIETAFKLMQENFKKHKTTDKNAHDSKQIKYKNWTVDDELEYQWEIKDNLVIGANGDGVQEARESRTAVTDKKSYPTLNNRLKQDFLYLLKNDEDIMKELNDFKEDTSKNLAIIDNPLDRINYQRGIGKVNMRGNDGISFVQGLVVVQERDELYVIRKDGSLANSNITRYKFSTLEEIDYRVVKLNSKSAYNEGLPYFINESGDVCFILRTSYDQLACIYNYTTDYKHKDMVLPGSSKHGIDRSKKYYYTNFGDATETFGIYLYDFESVKAMKPKLIRTIRFDLSVTYDEKIQSIAMVNNHFVLTQGKTQPKITTLNMNGSPVKSVSLSKQGMQDMLAETIGDETLNYSPVKYEAEGSGVFLGKDGNEYLLQMHVLPQSGNAFLTIVGERNGVAVDIDEDSTNTIIPKWKYVKNFKNDTKPYSEYWWEQPQYMIDRDGFITLRGICTYNRRDRSEKWTMMDKVLFTLPYPYSNYTNQFFKTVAGGNPDNTNRIKVSRNPDNGAAEVILVSTSDTSDEPFCVLDGIRFYSETRLERTELN